MGGLLHLVQRGGDWAGPQPAQPPIRCTKCNSPPINGQLTNFVLFDVAPLPLESKALIEFTIECWADAGSYETPVWAMADMRHAYHPCIDGVARWVLFSAVSVRGCWCVCLFVCLSIRWHLNRFRNFMNFFTGEFENHGCMRMHSGASVVI